LNILYEDETNLRKSLAEFLRQKYSGTRWIIDRSIGFILGSLTNYYFYRRQREEGKSAIEILERSIDREVVLRE